MLQIILLLLFIPNSQSYYTKDSDIIQLTDRNFNKVVINSDAVWLVVFVAPWCSHCQQFAPEFQKAAGALKGIAKVGAVNIDQENGLATRFNIRTYPTVKIFNVGENKPQDYNGPQTTSNLVNEVLAGIRNRVFSVTGDKIKESGDVVKLTDENFNQLVLQSNDMWLVEFYAPWCGHCKNLEPSWLQAATKLKGKVKLGALDATVNKIKASQYVINAYPTIKYFPTGKKDVNSTLVYDGGRSVDNIVNWALDKLVENMPAPEIIQIVNGQTFKEVCKKSNLCIVSVLPHILDCQANCRNSYLNVLRNLSDNYKKFMWGWVWAEAGAQSVLENAFEMGGFGYPAMAVFSAKKMKYSLLRGSFSAMGINEFLRDISYGRGNTVVVPGAEFPEIIETDLWDGKDGILPTEENSDEDFSNDNLNEKVEL